MPPEERSSCQWSREQDVQFEKALATYPDESSDRWEKIAADVSGKSLEEVKDHYKLLVDDVTRIESGCVPLPCYSSLDGTKSNAGEEETCKNGGNNNNSNNGDKGTKSDQERRKGQAWSEEEHKMFLLGLEKFGKGDWRSISRNFVQSRTPTQVASHAQKYYNRLNSMNKERRRSSIHDITNVNSGDALTPNSPITGLVNGSSVRSNTPTSQTPGMYEAQAIGPPVGPPAVGMPVNVSPPPGMAYGVPGPMVPAAPINMGPVPYPRPQTSTHR